MKKLKATAGAGLGAFALASLAATTNPATAQPTALDEEPTQDASPGAEPLDPVIWEEIDLPIHWRPFNPIVGASDKGSPEHDCPEKTEVT